MNHDDIICMAREAGYDPDDGGVFKFDEFNIERFAALVAAAERDACAEFVKEKFQEPSIATAIRMRVQK